MQSPDNVDLLLWKKILISGINFQLLLTELNLKVNYPQSKFFTFRDFGGISLWFGLSLIPFLKVALRDAARGGLGSADLQLDSVVLESFPT